MRSASIGSSTSLATGSGGCATAPTEVRAFLSSLRIADHQVLSCRWCRSKIVEAPCRSNNISISNKRKSAQLSARRKRVHEGLKERRGGVVRLPVVSRGAALRVIKSPVPLLHILWQLMEAGYEATCIKNVLSVSCRDYALDPPKPTQTFLKYVQFNLKGDILTLSEGPQPSPGEYEYIDDRPKLELSIL